MSDDKAEITSLGFAGSESATEFLQGLGAEGVPHSHRTFLDHLTGTAAILERWGASEQVCRAGLFHSIYGTEVFRSAMLPFEERARVVAVIGAEAEKLAYVFCAFERNSVYRAIERGAPYHVDVRGGGEAIDVSDRELRDLLWILWANSLEQEARSGIPMGWKIRSRKALAQSRPFLSERALEELDAFYGSLHGSATPEPGLRALLNLGDEADAFLAKVWPEQLYVADGPIERLAGLVDHDFDELVRMKKVFTRAFFRTVDGRSTSIMLGPGQERALYDAGFTIYFHNLSAPKLTDWVSAVDEELGLVRGVTRVAAFASRRGLGLTPHYDQNYNFVCQARGSKRWRIWPNTSVRYPSIGYTLGAKTTPVHEIEAPGGFPTELPPKPQVVEMRAGTVMFMPAGMWHDTETVEAESLHFNIQSGLASWKDALEYILTRTSALNREDWREPIRGLFEGDTTRPGFGEELIAKLREVVEELGQYDVEITRQPFFKFVSSSRPRD